MKHIDLKIAHGCVAPKFGGEPLSLGDQVVIDGVEYTLALEPKVEQYKGHVIKAWAIQTDLGFLSVSEVFPLH